MSRSPQSTTTLEEASAQSAGASLSPAAAAPGAFPSPGPGEPGGDLTARAKPNRGAIGDRIAAVLMGLCALAVLLLVLALVEEMIRNAWPSIRKFGLSFLITNDWNPVLGQFGALSSIYGTIVTSVIAMLIVIPMSLLISLFLVELAPRWLSATVGGAIELLAAIPSIIFGMWGLFIFAPFVSEYIEPWLKTLSFGLPIFSGPPLGIGVFPASLVLALMVLPFMTSVTRDVFRMTPGVMREAAYGLGSTTWETTRQVTLRYSLRGVIGGGFLALSRALGETMAVTFVIGNAHNIQASLFMPGNTISSTLANEFSEAAGVYRSALIELGLVLFGITIIVQVLAYLWLHWLGKRQGGRGA